MTFTVIEAMVYIDHLKVLIPQAQKRVVVAAMLVMSGPQTDDILHLLIAAAKRGVAVQILGDRYALSQFSRPGQMDMVEFKEAASATRRLFAELQAAGGAARWVGKVGLNPYAGRYHPKITIVDDDVFSFGGVNLRDDCYDNIDYMLHTQNAQLADTLQMLVQRNVSGQPTKDIELDLGDGQSLLFDAGTPRESIIYERACQLARQATSITYVSQMAPTGKLAKLLQATDTTYYANQPNKTGFRPDTVAQWFDQHTNGLKNHYEGHPYIHAKCILYDLKNGQKAILSGSHNFAWRGVAFGTKEIALCSFDTQLWRRLHDIVYTVATAE